MTKLWTAEQLIYTSKLEDRTVTEYPDTQAEWDALNADLLAECEDSTDISSGGYDGPEARGWTDYWGDGWRVHLVNPKEE